MPGKPAEEHETTEAGGQEGSQCQQPTAAQVASRVLTPHLRPGGLPRLYWVQVPTSSLRGWGAFPSSSQKWLNPTTGGRLRPGSVVRGLWRRPTAVVIWDKGGEPRQVEAEMAQDAAPKPGPRGRWLLVRGRGSRREAGGGHQPSVAELGFDGTSWLCHDSLPAGRNRVLIHPRRL